MRIEDLRKRWDEHATKHPIVPEMTFADGFLVLGAGTRLAKVGAPLNDLRLAARLAAAHRRPIEASPLRYIQRALAAAHNGDGPLAFMHIALSRLGKLADPREDARWLFMIDALLEAGGDPLTIVRELGTDPAACGLSLEKYSPDQPRVPACNGRPSGQWVGANSSGSATSPPPKNKRPSLLPIVETAYQGKYHDIVRDYFADSLRAAGNTVLTEVPLVMAGNPPPPSARIDILLRNANGLLFAIEVKTGDDPQFTAAQRILYPHIEPGGVIISPDPRVAQLGLAPFEPWPPIEAVVLYAPGPGSRMHFEPMSSFLKP